jgi:hypothetical protein
MFEVLKPYLPENAFAHVQSLFKNDKIIVKIKKDRKTKHGDYKRLPNGMHQITINESLNKYRFLITLTHEIAHFETYENYGRFIKPHGKEWKRTFQRLMLPFINPEVFPVEILPVIAKHFKNPKASSSADSDLVLALSRFDQPNGKRYVFELPIGSKFKMDNGRQFKKGNKLRKRFECIEIHTGKLYLFNPNAQVEFVNE